MRLPTIPPAIASFGRRLLQAPPPLVAVEIAEEHVAMARVARGSRAELDGYFVAPVPPGAVRTSPAQANILAPEALLPLLKAGRDRVSPGGGAVALVLPDGIARSALFPVDAVPRRREELKDLIAWRLKKTLPFKVEDAVMDAQAFESANGPVLLACAARRKLIAEHEALLQSAGFEVGTVTLSTLALAGQVPPEDGDTLLLNVGSGWFSILISRSGVPLFHRCKVLPEAERRGAQRNWFVGGELVPTLEYYRTRLGGGHVSRSLLHVSGPGWEPLREELAETVDGTVERCGAPPDSAPPDAVERLGPAFCEAAHSRVPVAAPAAAAPGSAA